MLAPADASVRQEYIPGELIIKFRPAAADALEKQLRGAKTPDRLNLSRRLDELNAKHRLHSIKPVFKDFKQNRRRLKALHAQNDTLLSKKDKHLLRRLTRAPKAAGVPELGRIYKLEFELQPGQPLQELVEQYRASPHVEYAELNYTISTCREPNDPLFPVQWPLENTGQIYPESGKFNHPPGEPDADIDAAGAWNFITDASQSVVAVIDTGVDYTHRDLADNTWVNPAEANGTPGLDDDGNGYTDDIYGYDFINGDSNPKDDHGHGTHCSGIIAAVGDNELDISGVCWKARIMALKCLGADGTGDTLKAAQAVYYAVNNGADVISNSWGGFLSPGSFPKALMDAFDYAYSQGVISVASAGNKGTTYINFPAIFDSVISVTATDSNDELAFFGNYGPYVDIAAPGVDVLSLRAQGTSIGTVYNDYTTIDSGTSMACPHVSGAFAMVLAYYPGVAMNKARDVIFQNTDFMPPEICNWGRLNLQRAISSVAHLYAGKVVFRQDVYSCSAQIEVILNDLHLFGCGTQDVNVSTTAGDLETVVLLEETELPGVCWGTINAESGEPVVQDGILQLSHNEKITVTYEDQDNGAGKTVTVTDTALTDCQPPIVLDVQVDAPGPKPTITFQTNEPTTGFVLCGTQCGGPYPLRQTGSTLATHHTVKLIGIEPYTDYFFVIQVFDIAGNESIYDNLGNCYAFTTTGPADMYVPAQYPTIQEAINRAWDTSVVWVADGVHSGDGNRDIDFKARAITVRSETGPANCIIDCNGTAAEPHSAFYFHSSEEANSVLSGFTITGGYSTNGAIAGAITCIDSNAVIANCVITGNKAIYGGAAICDRAEPTFADCTISANTAEYGGAIYSQRAGPKIINCIITGNTARSGGALASRLGSEKVTNSTLIGNVAEVRGGAIFSTFGTCTITNSIIWDNYAAEFPQLYPYVTVTYSCIQDWANAGLGNISADPCFVDAGFWDSNGTPDEPNDDFWVQGDYHLKSQAWRWSSPQNQWTWDNVTSRCIDAGNPGAGFSQEPLTLEVDPLNRAGTNLRLNMGAYGGTQQAAMSPYGWAILSDLNNDGTIDLLDLALWTDYLLESGKAWPGDLNRDEIVNMADFALLAKDWFLRTSWRDP